MKAKRNENDKIDLYLGRDMGSNMLKVDECSTLKELRKRGLKLLKEGATCAGNLPAREYSFVGADGNMCFGW